MRERLTKLLGKDNTSQLKMGTFHSLCARFLRKYAKLADIPENFTVCDATERCVVFLESIHKPYITFLAKKLLRHC